jgi:hypothetical protein
MLVYVLALAVGLGSLAIYLAAFFFPEIHRKNDFIWSGIGLFYALVLLVFAPIIQGGLLLGHLASVALLIWLGKQTLSLRRELTPLAQRTPIPSWELVKISVQDTVQREVSQLSLSARLSNTFQQVKEWVQRTLRQTFTQKPIVTPSSSEKLDATQETSPVLEQSNITETRLIQPSNPREQATQVESDLVIQVEEIKAEVKPDGEVTTSEETLTLSRVEEDRENPHIN